jgi:hypothetical protein
MHISVSEIALISPGPETERLCFVVPTPAEVRRGISIKKMQLEKNRTEYFNSPFLFIAFLPILNRCILV